MANVSSAGPSFASFVIPIVMFIGAGFSAAKVYDDKEMKSKMTYLWMALFVIFSGAGYYTLTKGTTVSNLRSSISSGIATGQQKYANWKAARATGIQGPPVGNVPPANPMAPAVVQ